MALRTRRLASGAAVLVVAGSISGCAAANIPSPIGSPVAGAPNGEGWGGVMASPAGTIVQPDAIHMSPPSSHRPIRYMVVAGDTLTGIARKFGIPPRDITWSNPGLRQPLQTGQALELPPAPGVVVTVQPDDNAMSLAFRYNVDATTILGFNDVQSGDVLPGMVIVIPIDPRVGPNLSTGMPADPIIAGGFVCPIRGARIVQNFGPTSFALEPAYAGYKHFHFGVDIMAGYGVPIVAAAGGEVTAVGYLGTYGIRVEITDSYGLVEIYAHMAAVTAAVGELVQQGQEVGLVGSTGLSVGPHLHFQLEVGGQPTNPEPLAGCST